MRKRNQARESKGTKVAGQSVGGRFSARTRTEATSDAFEEEVIDTSPGAALARDAAMRSTGVPQKRKFFPPKPTKEELARNPWANLQRDAQKSDARQRVDTFFWVMKTLFREW